MATFILIEINCDHLGDLDDGDGVGATLLRVCQNPHNAARVLEEIGLERVLRVVGQTGEPTHARDIKKYWLWKPA